MSNKETALARLTKKKGDGLSKFLRINSSPSTQLIANMQERINNPLFKLSMTDYEAMCGNNIMIKLICIILSITDTYLSNIFFAPSLVIK